MTMLGGSVAANAVTITSGTGAEGTARNCTPGVTSCDTISPVLFNTFGGNPGDASSSASQSPPDYGTSTASVTLTSLLGEAAFHDQVVGAPGTREAANGNALQSYTYMGSTPTTMTFSEVLTYSQIVTGLAAPSGQGVGALIDVFSLPPGALFDAGVSSADNDIALFSPSEQIGYVDIASAVYADSNTNAGTTQTLSVTVGLAPGETIWILDTLQAIAANGGMVEASMAPASVPEPATLSLFGLGLAAAAVIRRRRNRN